MKHSADRVLTTHVGSLPRPADLHAMSIARREGQKVDDPAFNARVRQAVSDIVRKQADLRIDIVDDGEMSKPSFITYINERLAGFEPTQPTEARARGPVPARSRSFRNSTPRNWPTFTPSMPIIFVPDQSNIAEARHSRPISTT